MKVQDIIKEAAVSYQNMLTARVDGNTDLERLCRQNVKGLEHELAEMIRRAALRKIAH